MNLLKKFQILTYNIGIINKDISQLIEKGIQSNDITWLKHKYKDRFFADPFLIKEENDYLFIVCEELVFGEGKGKISLLKVKKDDFSLEEKKVLIEEPWHLSFPFVYNEEYLLPESHRGGKAFLYHIDTNEWKVDSKKIVCNETGFIDPVIFKDYSQNEILLSSNNLSDKLFLYKKNIVDGSFYLTSKTPIMQNNRKARAAGRIFEYLGKQIFPVQDCAERYGRQTRLEIIKCISEKDYIAEEIAVLNSDKNPPFNETMHTFNVYNNFTIVDGSKDKVYFPMKLIYKMKAKNYANKI